MKVSLFLSILALASVFFITDYEDVEQIDEIDDQIS
jgi:hypothetical protein